MTMIFFIYGLTLVAFKAGVWWNKRYGWEEAHFHSPHEHECRTCGNLWEHDDMMAPIGYFNEWSEEEHVCKVCGAEVLEIQ